MNIDKVAQNIGQKDWVKVREYWQNFLHLFNFPITDFLNYDSLDDNLKEIGIDIKDTENNSTIRSHYFTIDGIQTRVFSDSIILFYKGINALKSAQCVQFGGYKTWSLNNYYQSSYFIIRSLLSILGIFSYRTKGNIDLLIDLLPHYKKINRKQYQMRRETYECQVQIVKQLDHWHNWRILQKVILYLKNPPIDKSFFKLLNLDPKQYARHRNQIIYQNDVWFFDDLKTEYLDRKFGIINIEAIEIKKISEEKYMSIVISYQLVFFVSLLFENISNHSKHFQAEFKKMEKSLIHKNNLNYNEFLNINYYKY